MTRIIVITHNYNQIIICSKGELTFDHLRFQEVKPAFYLGGALPSIALLCQNLAWLLVCIVYQPYMSPFNIQRLPPT